MLNDGGRENGDGGGWGGEVEYVGKNRKWGGGIGLIVFDDRILVFVRK